MEFNVHHKLKVKFRDIDMLGHVNNAVYLSYLEDARMAYYEAVMKKLPGMDATFILANANVNYRSPAYMGEDLDIAIGISQLKTTSFIFQFVITEVISGRLVADGSLVQVCYDYSTGEKGEIPRPLREKVCEFENLDRCWPE